MAKRSEFLYWNGVVYYNARFRHHTGSAWGDNTTDAGTDRNPVKSVSISEVIGNPRSGVVTIVNNPLDSASTTNDEGRGRFTGAFTDFQNVRIRDGETGTILLSGKIYDLEEKYEPSLGSIIILTIQDNLEELRNFTTGGWTNIPLAYTTGSRISSDIVTLLDNVKYLDTDSINFEGTGKKYEASATVYDQAGTIEFKGNNNKLLKTVSKMSALDPHADGVTDTYGYDYYVDPAVITNATNADATPDWNYFKRGTRPSSSPQTYGLTVKFPSASFTEDGYNSRMHSDFEFNEPKGELYSDVVLTYHDKGVRIREGENDDLTEGGEAEIVKTRKFERIDVASISGTFTGLDHPFGQSEIILFTPSGGSILPVGYFEYQSATSGSGFIIVSPLDQDGFTAAFPEVSGTITGGTSGTTALTGTTCRPAKNFGVRKTKTVTHTTIADVQKLRQEVTSYLSRSTTVIKRGNYRTSNYPYHYIDAAAAKVSRSSGTITFASAAFATNGGSATNNPELFGVKVGDVIAELDSTATSITRYAYISGTTSATAIYGGNTAAQTSDGTALDASKPMRIFIPLRAGHVIQTTNTLANVSGTHLVTELHFNEDNGLSFTRMSSVGKNDSASKLGHTGFEAVIEGTEKYGDDNVNKDTNIANVKSLTFTGTVSATDADTIAWTAGKLYDDAGGALFSIGSGNTGNMSEPSIVYFDPTASKVAFSTSTRAAYDDKVNRVKILAVNNTATSAGSQATFSYLTPVSGFSTLNQLVIGADAVANASMTATLSKKGVQPWATNIQFEGTAWNIIKWHKISESDTTSGNVSFADDVAEDITYSEAKVFSGDDLGETNYCYKTVGDSPSATLAFTRDYTELYKDDRILLATFVLAASDDDSGSPSIFPFNGNQATLSAGVIAAGAITAETIQAGVITADKITATFSVTGSTIQTSTSANTGIKLVGASDALRIYEGTLEFYNSSGYSRGTLRSQDFTWADTTVRPGLAIYGPSTSSLSSPTIANLALFGHQVGNSSQTYDAVSGQTANTSMLVYGSAELKGTASNHARVFFTASDGAPQGALYIAGGVPYNMPADLETHQRLLNMKNDSALADYWAFNVANSSSAYRKFMYASNTTADGTVGDSYSYIGAYDNSGTWTLRPLTSIYSYYFAAGDGSAAYPSYTFQSDYDTGFYYISADKIGFAASGAAKYYMDTGGIYPATDSSGGSVGQNLGASSQAWYLIHGYTLYMYNSASSTGTDLVVTAGNQIVKKSSSIQYKENVKNLAFDSSKLDILRPVSYNYKLYDAPDIGLIAEEVDEVYPELINYDKEGKPESVKYHSLSVMLLDEVNKLRKEVKILKEKN